jgi:predicted transcriptional regulator YdeE
MTTPLTALETIYIAGISVRTTNQTGQSGADIGSLWQRFFSEDITSKVSNKVSEDLYCIYTDYESDHTGAYTTILGYPVEKRIRIPENLVLVSIPAGTYRCYTSEGTLPDCVFATWQHIWQTATNRSYKADFDVYGPEAHDRNNARVQTFLSVTS